MKKDTLKTKASFLNDNLLINDSLHIFDLPTLIEKMKHKHTWIKGELNAKVLLKNPEKQIVLTILHGGTKIKSFQSNDSITFQIIEGKLKFHTHVESATLNKGQLLTLNKNINYNLKTKEETVLLLTIANGKLQKD